MLVGRLWRRQNARSSRVSTCLFGGWRGQFFCRGRRVARERFFPVIEIGLVLIDRLHVTQFREFLNAPPNTASTNTQPDSSVYCYTQKYSSHA